MKLLLPILVGIFGISFLTNPQLAGGWFWDLGNGLGFAAFAGMLYVAIIGSRPLGVRPHQSVSYTVLVMGAAHAFWFLLGDAAAVEYIRPGAPIYMWAGVASLILLCIVITVSLPPDRQRVHSSHSVFKYWHQLLSVSAIAAGAYHIVGSGFYLSSWYQALLLSLLALLTCFARPLWQRIVHPPFVGSVAYLAISVVLIVVFSTVRNFER
ncbi:MAG: ferric reductase-like transmembrane domain-containing protein [Halioglobus sp.]